MNRRRSSPSRTTPPSAGTAQRREAAMRTFSCFTFDDQRSVPTLSFIFAEDEMRARLLARRELLDTPKGASVEIYERDRLLWVSPSPWA